MFYPNNLLTLTTDFGTDSFYVAEMKAAVYRVAEHARIVDVTHAVPPQEVTQASWLLLRTIEAFPAGTVHVCVVDPGVGTARKIVAAVIAGQVVIGPDNGLFGVIAAKYLVEVVHLVENSQLFGPRRSATFHGRDIMAPAAAHLVQGVPLKRLGPRWERPLIGVDEQHFAQVSASEIRGRLVYADSFGNIASNIFAADLPEDWDRGRIRVLALGHEVQGIVDTYGHCPADLLVALFGSSGQLELAVVQGNAAQKYRFQPGCAVVIVRDEA